VSAALREAPRTAHPGRDNGMSEAEQQHCRALIGSLSAGVNFALGVDDETAIAQGVPPTIRYRCMAWATLHRTAMSFAHYMAIAEATDAEVEEAAQALGNELRDLIIKQMPGSREVVSHIEARGEHD
jgi:hypothetical protein